MYKFAKPLKLQLQPINSEDQKLSTTTRWVAKWYKKTSQQSIPYDKYLTDK